MEMCEDMVVDLNVRKRQCMDAVMDHPLNKRTCQGLASLVTTNGVLLKDYEMVSWHLDVAPSVKEPGNGFVLHGGIQQHCKGHINHILRL
ncbi:hypothetical protein GDO78_008022 [Eleutherodactylus coqui]|uniref:Uncharacterized protein n=1 Tax=Eleutherodactylus coqui TaxID=57060 RepID=A0A8J6FA90_ELECQ|nr:hypothetical protein GDO78_008022 [Eleutherodactylus coqui]